MRRLKWILGFVLSLSLLLVGCTPGTSSPDGEEGTNLYYLGTGSVGGMYFTVGAAIGSIVSSQVPNVKVNAQITSGATENVSAYVNHDIDMGMMDSETAYVLTQDPDNTTSIYADRYGFGLAPDATCIMALEPSWFVLIARENADFNSIEDLKGSNLKLGIGAPGASAYTIFQEVIDVLGIREEDLNTYPASHSTLAESLKDGNIDVMMNVLAGPTGPVSSLAELSTSTDVRYIPLSQDFLDRFTEKYPVFKQGVIPAGWVDDITEDTLTFYQTHVIVVNPELPEDVVYNITAAIFDNLDELAESTPSLSWLNKENAAADLPVRLHPGAQRYFEEHGYTISYIDGANVDVQNN